MYASMMSIRALADFNGGASWVMKRCLVRTATVTAHEALPADTQIREWGLSLATSGDFHMARDTAESRVAALSKR